MKYHILYFVSFFILGTNLNEIFSTTTEDLKILDKYMSHLDQFGDRVSLRAYADLPDPDIFINYEVISLRPSKFVNYSSYLTPLFDKWDENKFIENLQTTFVFANQTEIIKENQIETKTNLRRFLTQRDQYFSEVRIEYVMPNFLR
jgi:hypothetical protein